MKKNMADVMLVTWFFVIAAVSLVRIIGMAFGF